MTHALTRAIVLILAAATITCAGAQFYKADHELNRAPDITVAPCQMFQDGTVPAYTLTTVCIDPAGNIVNLPAESTQP